MGIAKRIVDILITQGSGIDSNLIPIGSLRQRPYSCDRATHGHPDSSQTEKSFVAHLTVAGIGHIVPNFYILTLFNKVVYCLSKADYQGTVIH